MNENKNLSNCSCTPSSNSATVNEMEALEENSRHWPISISDTLYCI